MDYKDVQRGLNDHKKITGAKTFNSDDNPRSYVENVLGFPKVAIAKKEDGSRMTAREFCQSHPKGRYIISMSGHWSAVINGTVVDTWDCSDEGLYSFYAITPIEGYEKRPITSGFIIKIESNEKASVNFYDSNGNKKSWTIPARYADGYRACLIDMGRNQAIDWSDEKWR
ncbi:MAG: hypothetical protein IJZ03_06215 [Clostridia bacterium]|nr:hypothetical protein [Clostridia bacterium]